MGENEREKGAGEDHRAEKGRGEEKKGVRGRPGKSSLSLSSFF